MIVISAAYNFTSTGYGTYTIEPSDLLHAVGSNNEISEIHADVEPFAATIAAGKLVVARPSHPTGGSLAKRATFTNCTASQQTQVNTAASGAQNYASTSLTYLRTTTNTTRFRTWFGSYDGDRHDTVTDHFSRMNANNFANFQYDCSCTTAGVFAYVYPDQFGTVNLCPLFWPAPQTGTDSKAGTLIHEASHFTANGGTFDIAYGQAQAQALATAFPEGAVINADNHQYFAENNPALP
uniref:Lysine-specific metallo-endopeptidase domain-containing protein n=1 Tax=Ganoderma boninense TaxID=34458 RepID=A0A5K1JXS3_9APHY|nr:Uncharacterized protein [Ganoderma boninense]